MTREELEEKISWAIVDYGNNSEGIEKTMQSALSLIDLYISTLPQTVWCKENKIILNT